MYMFMDKQTEDQKNNIEWFAIKTRQDFRAESALAPYCDEVFLPKEAVKVEGKKDRIRALIPHVLFIKTTRDKALELEREGREHPESSIPFWIYRYPHDNQIQTIHPSSIHLLRLLTSDDTTGCQIFNKKDFKTNQRVRITNSRFKGFEGQVVRVKKNKHVVVKIEGVCMVMLPFIHPDFLEVVG